MASDERSGSPTGLRFMKMIVPIVMRTCQSNEQGTRAYPARVDFDSGKIDILAEKLCP